MSRAPAMATVACVVSSECICALGAEVCLLTRAQRSLVVAESWTAVDTLFGGERPFAFVLCQLIYLTPVAQPNSTRPTQALISGCACVLGDISLLLYV